MTKDITNKKFEPLRGSNFLTNLAISDVAQNKGLNVYR